MSSTISATDVQVFKTLSNNAIVDVQVESRTRRATAEMQQAMEKAAMNKVPKEPTSPASSIASAGVNKSTFQLAQEAEALRESVENGAARTPPTYSRPAYSPPSPPASPPPSPVREEVEAEESDNESTHSNPSPPKGSEEERLEKQGFLIELANMRQKGIQLSRNFTINDSVAELEFEVQKQNNNISTRHTVTFMRDMLRIIINGIEIGNNRFGPFLTIDGWAESVTQDMGKYEHALERIYKRYWRKSQMSPIMELSWLLIGSMVTWHFKNKFFGPPAASATNRPTTSSESTHIPESKSRKNNKSSRPVLRPPSAMFGM